jgi:hypothetical protein
MSSEASARGPPGVSGEGFGRVVQRAGQAGEEVAHAAVQVQQQQVRLAPLGVVLDVHAGALVALQLAQPPRLGRGVVQARPHARDGQQPPPVGQPARRMHAGGHMGQRARRGAVRGRVEDPELRRGFGVGRRARGAGDELAARRPGRRARVHGG